MEHINTPEQEAIARENVARANAEWAAEVRAKQAHQRLIADTARDPSVVERQANEARRELGLARADAARIDPADHEARLVAAEAVEKAARTALDIISIRAQAAEVRALGEAGSDPVKRAKAVAAAKSAWADTVGSAEAEFEAANFAADKAAIATAEARKVAAHRHRAAEARMAEMEKGEQDPWRKSNPFADPIRPTITQAQFDSIRDPGLKARAAKEANIVPDDDPTLTADDVRRVLDRRGSKDRAIVSRAQLRALSPADAAEAARRAILIE